jgi:hypothetical protein
MNWLSRLSFAQAIRWALLWPALLALLCTAAVLIAVRGRDEWAVGLNFQSTSGLPVWLAVVLGASLFLCGPPILFLLLWRVARH